MIEQVNNALMVVAFFANSTGEGVTGLTVTVDAWRVINNAGTPSSTQILTNAAATAIGGGFYARIIASADVTLEGEYPAVFKTTSVLVRDKQLPAMWSVNVAGVEHLDEDISAVTAASTALSNITVVAMDGLTLVPYGSMLSQSLSGSIFDVTVPARATYIAVQAVDQDIYYTDDNSAPSTSNGFVLYAGEAPRFIRLDEYHNDQLFRFLRSAAGASLRYRYYRPE